MFVNNQPATVAVLRQLAPYLATIHAQNESLLSFDAPTRLRLLDSFANTQTDATAEAFSKWKSIQTRIAELERDEQDRLRLLDLWTFQAREIEDAKLQPGEDERLETEKRVLANAEKIHSAAMNAFDLLYEGEASTSASLRTAQKHIEELARYEPKFQETMATLETARISVEDVGASLRDYAGGIEASPEHLAEVEDRLAAMDRLKRKYGPTLDDVIKHGEEVSRKLSEMENKDEILRQLRAGLAQAAEQYLNAARVISKKRYESARKLEKLVEAEINDLAMKSSFRIEVSGTDEEGNWTAAGFDQVVYMIATNPGEPLRQLEHIASGGELSRVMLALKASVEAGSAGARKKSVGSTADAGLRRNRYRHRRAGGGSGREEAQEPFAVEPGALRDPPAPDCHLRRPSLSDRKESRRRTDPDDGPCHHRNRTHRRSSPHAERRQADRNLAQARRADVEDQRLKSRRRCYVSRERCLGSIVLPSA